MVPQRHGLGTLIDPADEGSIDGKQRKLLGTDAEGAHGTDEDQGTDFRRIYDEEFNFFDKQAGLTIFHASLNLKQSFLQHDEIPIRFSRNAFHPFFRMRNSERR